MRTFHFPRAWLAGWIALLVLVVIGSMLPSSGLPQVSWTGADKLQHAAAYAVLAGYAVMLFARPRTWAVAGVALLAFGIGIELAQGALTSDRLADPGDAVANASGIVLGLLVARTRFAGLLQRLDARWAARARQRDRPR